MLDWKITVLIIAAASLIVAAFMGRYELVPALERPITYRIDHWTGEVVLVVGENGARIKIKDAPP